MIIVIIAITIIVIRIIEVKVIRIEILQGASLGMGSLHIKVIVSDIEGRDYNRSTINVIVFEHTGPYLMSSPWRKYCIHHLSNAYQASPYDPHSCTESCGWSRRRPSKQLPSSRRLESQP